MTSNIFNHLLKSIFCLLPFILMLLLSVYLDEQKIILSAYGAAMGGITGLAGTMLLLHIFFSPKAKVHVTYDYTDFFKHIMHRHNVKYQLKDLLASYSINLQRTIHLKDEPFLFFIKMVNGIKKK